MVTRWVRYQHEGRIGFGTLDDDGSVREHEGSLFGRHADTGRRLAAAAIQLLMPTEPGKVIALWNNFHALREKLNLDLPAEPLYLLKSPNTYLAPGGTIRVPHDDGKVVFEGELGIVIGRRCSAVSEQEAPDRVFGYTCANDVTRAEVLLRDKSFAQWTRAKGYDTFCPLGPAIATGLDPSTLRVKTLVDGQVRQDYPISDMRFSVAQLVSLISHDMTLQPGDVILCGTSVGVGSMKPGCEVAIDIEGIGTLRNRYARESPDRLST